MTSLDNPLGRRSKWIRTKIKLSQCLSNTSLGSQKLHTFLILALHGSV